MLFRGVRGALTALFIFSVVSSAPAASAVLTDIPASSAPLSVEPPPVTAPEAMVVSHGQVKIDGKPLNYTVHTGLLPIYDNDTAQLAAHIFVVAYTVDRPKGSSPRPLTFIWNGGPGSSASELHLVGLGPKHFLMPAQYPQWKSQPSLIGDNPQTWLTASDLVFVDPVGTGYSRAVNDTWRDRLYTQWGDAEAVAEAIRVYRTRFDAFDAPIFLAGESYGTVRCMEVAADLARRRTPVAGVILMSDLYYAGEPLSAPLEEAMQVPLYTAIAWYHHRLTAALQSLSQPEALRQAAAWARGDYAAALARRDSLTDAERAAVVQGLVLYTGLDAHDLDPKTLTVSKSIVTDHLLEDNKLELGRYDAREALPLRDPAQAWGPRQDPSLLPMVDLMEGTSPALIRYLRYTLGYRNDLLYRGPWGGSFHPDPMEPNPLGYADDWMALMWEHRGKSEPPEGGEAHEVTAFRQALKAEANMLVWNISGLYDQSCAERDEALARAEPAVKARVRNSCYRAGHMVYTDLDVRRQMQQDFAHFVEDAAVAEKRLDVR